MSIVWVILCADPTQEMNRFNFWVLLIISVALLTVAPSFQLYINQINMLYSQARTTTFSKQRATIEGKEK